jgi:hypothetical protein
MAVNVMTMEERMAGKKLRGLAKFKEDVKKVGKKVGAGIKKGSKAVGKFIVDKAKDPAVQKKVLLAAATAAGNYFGGPMAGAAAGKIADYGYGALKKSKTPSGPVTDIQMEKVNTGPRYYKESSFVGR